MPKSETPEPTMRPASPLLVMLLDRIDADASAQIQAAINAEAESAGLPDGAQFNVTRRVWVIPAEPAESPK